VVFFTNQVVGYLASKIGEQNFWATIFVDQFLIKKMPTSIF
jgi:hypothetical protein